MLIISSKMDSRRPSVQKGSILSISWLLLVQFFFSSSSSTSDCQSGVVTTTTEKNENEWRFQFFVVVVVDWAKGRERVKRQVGGWLTG
ncbi:hypothetical protein BKA57DRAFT_466437 [Linnemannia elongata]|nr:hypothetical protein BKA57DRAFT_466437 [Linnemannia elongata]